jgi:hypothetical protein
LLGLTLLSWHKVFLLLDLAGTDADEEETMARTFARAARWLAVRCQ